MGFAGPVLSAMGKEALRKSGCFGLILVAGIYGIISLFRGPDRVRNFAIIVGIVGGGYIIFLMICYLGGAFNEGEVRKAASFYRYGTHVGLLNIGLVWIAAPRLFGWLKERTKLLPLLLGAKLVRELVCALSWCCRCYCS